MGAERDEYVMVVVRLRRPPRSTQSRSSAASDVYKRQVFVQGDHFQFNAKKFKEDREKEIKTIKKLIKEAIAGGYYNIDIDSSTLVDLSKATLDEQQKDNYEMAAEMTAYILSLIHISEPTRLLSTSYAVLCLKKKKQKNSI